jgi:hypothetical protein
MVDAQTVSIVFAGLSIGIAAIYYTLTIRNSQRNQELAESTGTGTRNQTNPDFHANLPTAQL